jgi:ribonuclease BN (tRNA processing enzyme)
LPDLIYTPRIMRRTAPLDLYGQEGSSAMIEHIQTAWSMDTDIRTSGLERGNATGSKVNAHEIAPGVVYQDSIVKVTAFRVKHGSWKDAFGFGVDTPDQIIVISGDEAPSDAVAQQCNRCDALIHEVYSEFGYAASAEPWRAYLRSFHTSTRELAAMATAARPKTPVLYHQMYFGGSTDTDARIAGEIRALWRVRVVSSRDLDVC